MVRKCRVLTLLLLMIFVFLLVDYFMYKKSGYDNTFTGYFVAESNHFLSPPNQKNLSTVTGVRSKGRRYRTFNLPRLSNPKQIKSKSQQTGKRNCTKWIVFKTIYNLSESVRRIKQIVESRASWCSVVVFDKKTPADEYKIFQSNKFILLTVEDQHASAKNEPGYKTIQHLPWNNFSRTNIGYLYAIHQNAKVIYEMDDNSLLLPDDNPIAKKQNDYLYVASPDHVYNPYGDLIQTNSSLWPKGLPLNFTKAKICRSSLDHISIRYFFAKCDPGFSKSTINNDKPVILKIGTMSPFNGEATLYLTSAFYGLFLPTTVNGQESDILRSYFTQRLQWDIGGNIAFIKRHIKQRRISHDYMATIRRKIPIHSTTHEMIKFLVHWKSKSKTLEERMEELAIEFYERGYWELNDVILIQMWIRELHEHGYHFPKIQSKQDRCSDLKDKNTPKKQKPKKIENPQREQASKRRKKYKLQVFLRLCSKPFVVQLYNKILLPSMKLFWQEEVVPLNMLVVLDDESPEDHALGKNISQVYPHPEVFYEPLQAFDNGNAYSRMQWGMFWADNYTESDYVAFIDTDTLFTTLVTRKILFEGNKPRISGIFNKPQNGWWKRMPLATHYVLKKKEVFRAMSYFPVILKVQHLVQLRKYVELVHRKSFSIVWRDMTKRINPFSQFNIMANYVWYFHRNEYTWHMEESGGPGYEESIEGQTNDFSKITPQMKVPYPRSSIHYKYIRGMRSKSEKNWNPRVFDSTAISFRNRFLREGYCFSAGFRLTPEKCKHFSENSIQYSIFYFEAFNWAWDKRCYQEQRKYYDSIRNEKHVWDEKILREIFQD